MLSTMSKDARILDGMKLVTQVLQDKRFIEQIANIRDFDMCDMIPTALIAYVERHMEKFTVEVATFRPFNPWSRAMAMYTPKHPDRISLSSRKLTRVAHDAFENAASIAGSIVHEIIHLINRYLENFTVWHGDNSPVGKEMTAPYRIGREAKEFILANYRYS